MSQGQQQQTTATANFAWLLALMVLIALFLWWIEHPLIVRIVFVIREAEVFVMRYIFDGLNALIGALHLPTIAPPYWYRWGHFMFQAGEQVDYKAIGWQDVVLISRSVGTWLTYLFSMASVFFLYRLLFRHSGSKFSRTFSMKTLRASEASIWPAITPILNTALVQEDLNTGPWAMARMPLDFAKDHDLLYVKKEKNNSVWAVHEDQAETIFTKQLGPLWRGVENASPHVQALVVIFVARTERKKDIAKKLLDQLAISSSGSQLDYSGIAELVQEYRANKVLVWLEKRHAYTLTFMASLLALSRAEGVLASAEFLWLKVKDRPLWYILNSVGRQTAVVEVAGPIAHWVAEKKLKRALKTPMISRAVAAFSEEMGNILHVDKEDSWRTSNEG